MKEKEEVSEFDVEDEKKDLSVRLAEDFHSIARIFDITRDSRSEIKEIMTKIKSGVEKFAIENINQAGAKVSEGPRKDSKEVLSNYRTKVLDILFEASKEDSINYVHLANFINTSELYNFYGMESNRLSYAVDRDLGRITMLISLIDASLTKEDGFKNMSQKEIREFVRQEFPSGIKPYSSEIEKKKKLKVSK